MDLRMTTIATKLRGVGYHTVAIGKWHAGMSTPAHVPGARGFDRSLGYLAGSEDHFTHQGGGIQCKVHGDQANGTRAVNGTPRVGISDVDGDEGYGGGGEGVGGGGDGSGGGGGEKTALLDLYDTLAPVVNVKKRYGGVYNGDIFGTLAVATVKNYSTFSTNSNRFNRATPVPTQQQQLPPSPSPPPPLFMYLAFANAHHPMEVPAEWLKLYPNVTTPTRQTYQAMVSFVDVAIGNLTSAVKAVDGMWERTLVVICSDNGGSVPLRSPSSL